MRPADKGRFCGSCSKIVVDFSVMSDQEVLNYLGSPGRGGCGRFAPDQLERGFALVSPVQKKKGWMAWNFLLAGVLFCSRGMAQSKPAKVVPQQEVVMEGVSRGIRIDAGLAPIDSVKYKVLPDVVVVGYGTTRCTRVTGAYSTVMGEMQSKKTDTLYSLLQKVKDSLNLLYKKALDIYPNPVRKGAVVRLAWQADAGRYQVGLFNAAGALLQQRWMEVGSSGQTDLFEIPAALAAGTYFFRAVREGSDKVITRKIVVI